MIEKRNAIAEVMRRAAVLPLGHALEVRSYKRDRGFMLVREGEADYRLIEEGFEQARVCVRCEDLKRLLKTVVKREFPRSNKLRIYETGEFREWVSRKVL
ncbi:hypothetical protein [Thiohalomonas denitrificans]|uniref:hypothetical protein n=1 Tax=Thiohalomonas denitrificans TaxID=415747 RepID=UPI0026ECA93D|nr:hypothetical protein [Thiohalomonas denitrificans]